MNSFKSHSPRFLVIAVEAAAMFLTACSGSGGSNITPPPPPQQVAMPSASPAAGTYSATQDVVLSSTTTGAVIYYTTDGSVPTSTSKKYSKPISVSVSSTIKAYATAVSYDDSGVLSAAYTINVPQSVSWAVASLKVSLNGSLALDSSQITASSSCGPAAVQVSIKPTSSDTALQPGDVFAAWVSDSTNTTYGSISGGNTLPEDSTNTYTAKVICGSSTASVPLVVGVPSPTITSVKPTTVKSTGSYTFDLYGSGYVAGNATNINQWLGTETNSQLADSDHPACPTVAPIRGASGGEINWVSDIHAQQTGTGTEAIGNWYYWVINFPAADGTGGGYQCLNNAYTVVANSAAVVGGSIVQLHRPTQGKKTDTLDFYSQSGTLQHSVAVPAGTSSLSVVDDMVYAPNPSKHQIASVDSHLVVTNLNTGEFKPVFVVGDKSGRLYIAAHLGDDNSRGAIVRLEKDGSLTRLADAQVFDDLQITTDNRLLWPAGNLVHILDLSSGSEQSVDLGRSVDSLHQLSSGEVAVWQTGETKVGFVDLSTLRQTGEIEVPAGVYGFSGDYLSLANGNIGKISVTGFQKVASVPVAELYAGFSVVRSKYANPVVYTLAGKNRKLRSITP